ncbi:MAG: beta-ketoacyl synthase N-terminal-like domain-containing protein [Planctomycetota bacterium]
MFSPDSTITDILRWRCQHQADRIALYTPVSTSGDADYKAVTYHELASRAESIAAAIKAAVAEGKGTVRPRILVAGKPGVDFTAAFFGCLFADTIPVPLPERNKASEARWDSVISDCQLIAAWHDGNVEVLPTTDANESRPVLLAPNNEPAFLQYTSGSTGQPKGVIVTHDNLQHNLQQIRERFQHDENSVGVIWLPPYHDMGLIGGILQPIFVGFPVVLMTPLSFVRNPFRWLQTISRFKATTSGGPDFAYKHALKKISADQKQELDLSSWKVAFAGAETVRPETLRSFADAFAECGFDEKAFLPCYGLAETTLMVSGERGSWSGSLSRVGNGSVIDGLSVAIVDSESNPVTNGETGEIWVSGASVAAGYWGRPSESADTFAATMVGDDSKYLRTGDLGYLKDGELFVCGRVKDLIVVRGQNYYPADIETSIEQSPSISNNSTAVVQVEKDAESRLLVVQELRRSERNDQEKSDREAHIRKVLSKEYGLAVDEIRFVDSLPRTSSGKIKRHACASLPGRSSIPVEINDSNAEDTDDLRTWLVELIASKLNVSPASLRTDQPLAEMGIDSVAAVELAHELSEYLGLEAPIEPTFVWQHPTINAVYEGVRGDGLHGDLVSGKSLAAGASANEPAARALPLTDAVPTKLLGLREKSHTGQKSHSAIPAKAGTTNIDPIAIVGISCRFPSGVQSPNDYWQLLNNGTNAIGNIPDDRWDVQRYYDADFETPGKMYTCRGGFVDGVADFDPEFFSISPREAKFMDPQQRLLLEGTWLAIRDAGIQDPFSLRGNDVGCYVGLSLDDYAKRKVDTETLAHVNQQSSLGSLRGLAAGRIAYVFGFQGPTMQLDTTCSSSLVATHLACQALRTGETRMAVAAGVNLILAPESTIACCKLRALSASGQCATFSSIADGYVRGEGCGVVLLQRLSDAIADGRKIYATIPGSAVNHDGQSNGLTAPNGNAQVALIQEALRRAGKSSDEVDYIEAHGTATPLGDPIELNALNEVFANRNRRLAIGSVKTNIGHLESAAGIAGLIKVVLSMQHGHIPKHLNCEQLTEHFNWNNSSLQVSAADAEWRSEGENRIAGVSSFGMSGTNAHVVVERHLNDHVRSNDSEIPAPPFKRQRLWIEHHSLSLKAGTTNVVLKSTTPGALEGLQWQSFELDPPKADEVQIRVLEAGLNFRDVLIGMDLYPEPAELGCECVGVVEAVGEAVNDIQPGDRVMAIGAECFADYVTVSRKLVAKIDRSQPDSMVQPVAICTAAWALIQLADLKAGESVLIHHGTGGVGQAAISIARSIGAKVFSTASKPKWGKLKELGVEHPLDSRSLDFAEELKQQTSGRGVDVVINTLVGDGRWKSVEALTEGGRFIEIGKGEGPTPDEIMQRRSDVVHHTFDLGKTCGSDPEAVQSLLVKIIEQIGSWNWHAPSTTTFSRTEFLDAFRLMQSGKHTGKLVIRMDETASDGFDSIHVSGQAISSSTNTTLTHSELESLLCKRVCKVLGYSTDQLDREKGFFELGLDSLTALELKNSIQRELNIEIPSTAIFDYPDTNSMLAFLADQLNLKPETLDAGQQLDQILDEAERMLAR